MPTTFSSPFEVGQFEAELGTTNKPASANQTNQTGGILGELARKQQASDEVWERFLKEKTTQPTPSESRVQIEEIRVERIEIGGFQGLKFEERELQASNEQTAEQTTIKETHGSLSFKKTDESKAEPPERKGFRFEIPTSVQKASEKALEIGSKAGKRTYVEFKDVKSAMIHLVKDSIFFSLKKDKDPKKAHEAAEKKAKRLAIVKAFFAQLKEGLLIFKNKKLEDEANEEKQLGIAGMNEEERNELLGKNRNKKNKNIQGSYFHHATADELVNRKNSQQKAEKAQAIAETSKPVVNMHGAIEGGTGGGKVNVSTTGGAGVG